MSYSETLLPEFDEEMKNTRSILACVPDAKFDYRPHAKSMTLVNLASHVAEMPSWVMTTLDHERLEMSASYKPYVATSVAAMLEAFDAAVSRARARIVSATEEEWKVNWVMTMGEATIVSSPRSEVMRRWVMNHMIHHRAQLGVYLRLCNVAIPGMYGPSADDMTPAGNQ